MDLSWSSLSRMYPVNQGIVGEVDWIIDGARYHSCDEVLCSPFDAMACQDVPELGEVIDPGGQFLVPVVDHLAPGPELNELPLFEFLGFPTELLPRLTRK